MATFVVEHDFEGQSFDRERYDAVQRRRAACLEIHGVTHIVSYVTPDGRRMICVVEAPDAEAVRRTARSLGFGYDRVWPATVVRDRGGAQR